MVAAAQPHLTDSKTVMLFERDTSAYHLSVRTLTDETPDEDKVLRALMSQKPAGIVLDYDTVSGQTYLQLRTDYATYTLVEADYETYLGVREDAPGT
jgi:hypothetical protein